MRVAVVETVLLAGGALVVVVLLLQPRNPGPRTRGVLRASWTLTPGVVNPAVTQATLRSTVCRKGWTRTVRPPTSAYQEDHLISLELGGNPTDTRNLWPEPYPRAAEVDRVENELNARLCARELTLDQAQRMESALKHRDG